MNQSRNKHHNNLWHYGKFDKVEDVEEDLRPDRKRQSVHVV